MTIDLGILGKYFRESALHLHSFVETLLQKWPEFLEAIPVCMFGPLLQTLAQETCY